MHLGNGLTGCLTRIIVNFCGCTLSLTWEKKKKKKRILLVIMMGILKGQESEE